MDYRPLTPTRIMRRPDCRLANEDGGNGHVGPVDKIGFRSSWWVVVLLYLLVAPSTCSGSQPIDWGKYDKFLESSCLPPDRRSVISVHQYYVDFLATHTHTNVTWLPIKRRDLKGWHWLSGEYQGKTLSQTQRHGRDCGVLRADVKILDDYDCDQQYPKYMCHKKMALCNPNDSNCFVYNQTRYTVVTESSNWYEARAGCYARGEELASLPKMDQEQIFDLIQQRTKTDHDIWVGLRKKDYYIATRAKAIEIFWWRMGDDCPCKSYHNCVALSTTHASFWEPQNCLDNIAFPVCDTAIMPDTTTKGVLSGPGHDEMTTPMQGTNGKPPGPNTSSKTFRIVIAFLTISIIWIMLALIVLAIKRRKRIAELVKRKRTVEEPHEVLQE